MARELNGRHTRRCFSELKRFECGSLASDLSIV